MPTISEHRLFGTTITSRFYATIYNMGGVKSDIMLYKMRIIDSQY